MAHFTYFRIANDSRAKQIITKVILPVAKYCLLFLKCRICFLEMHLEKKQSKISKVI